MYFFQFNNLDCKEFNNLDDKEFNNLDCKELNFLFFPISTNKNSFSNNLISLISHFLFSIILRFFIDPFLHTAIISRVSLISYSLHFSIKLQFLNLFITRLSFIFRDKHNKDCSIAR